MWDYISIVGVATLFIAGIVVSFYGPLLIAGLIGNLFPAFEGFIVLIGLFMSFVLSISWYVYALK